MLCPRWSTVDKLAGRAAFEVDGLTINGGNATGTPGAISAVTGILVCNTGDQTR